MPKLREFLQGDGAVVDLQLGWSVARAHQLRAALKPVPPGVVTRAILDTGAEMTCVDVAIINGLGLPFMGMALANLPAHGGITGAARYHASATIIHPSGNPRDNLFIRNISVLGLSLASLQCEVLVGRDVLAKCRFLYDGPGNQFELEY